MDSYQECLNRWSKLVPKEEKDRVFNARLCDIDCSFVGFIETYEYLSKLIPKDWTIFDFGCAYNPQCYFFKEHNAYHAIEPDSKCGECEEVFHTENTIIHRCTTKEFLEFRFPKMNLDIKKCFAIVNNVPNWYQEDSMKLVHEYFRNCYTFYIA